VVSDEARQSHVGFSVLINRIPMAAGIHSENEETYRSTTTMNHISKITLLITSFAISACSDMKSRDFFAAGGITIGAPAATEPGTYRIPIEFETKIEHSGQWIDAVSANVSGSDILVTATFTSANRKSGYPGYVELKGIPAGTYALKYQDPDGTEHPIGRVVLP
jgi:hypothetical protein